MSDTGMSDTLDLLHEARGAAMVRQYNLRRSLAATAEEIAAIDRSIAICQRLADQERAANDAGPRDVGPHDPWPFTDHRSQAAVITADDCGGAA